MGNCCNRKISRNDHYAELDARCTWDNGDSCVGHIFVRERAGSLQQAIEAGRIVGLLFFD